MNIYDYRFYENVYPDRGDIIMVKILSKNDGYHSIRSLEYGCGGLITDRNLRQRGKRSRKKNLVNIGDVIPAEIINIDDNNYLELSRYYLAEDETANIIEEYKWMCKIHRLGLEIAYLYDLFTKDKNDVYSVLSNTTWRIMDTLYDKNEDIDNSDIYRYILSNISTLFDTGYFDNLSKDYILNNIVDRITEQELITETDISLKVYSEDGINAIKDIFNNVSKIDNKNVNVKILMSSAPIYKIYLTGGTLDEHSDIIDNIMDNITKKIDKYNAQVELKEKLNIIKNNIFDIKFLSEYDFNKLVNCS